MDTMTLDTRALQLPLDFSDGAGPASPYRPSPAPSALRRLVADVLSAEPAAVAAVGQVSNDQQSVGCAAATGMNLGEPFATSEPLPALH